MYTELTLIQIQTVLKMQIPMLHLTTQSVLQQTTYDTQNTTILITQAGTVNDK
jgi:hypothetical protein